MKTMEPLYASLTRRQALRPADPQPTQRPSADVTLTARLAPALPSGWRGRTAAAWWSRRVHRSPPDPGSPQPDGDDPHGTPLAAVPVLAIFALVAAGLFLLPLAAVLWGLLLILLAFVAGQRAERRFPRDEMAARREPPQRIEPHEC
jgi:hypothetical protein